MTPKQKHFAREWVIDKNASRAAIAAGYAANSARITGCRLLTNNNIKGYIDKLLEKQAKNLDITAEKILRGIADIAFNKEVNEAHRLKGYELLGKNQKLFTDKVELGPTDTDKQWKIEIVDSDKD